MVGEGCLGQWKSKNAVCAPKEALPKETDWTLGGHSQVADRTAVGVACGACPSQEKEAP